MTRWLPMIICSMVVMVAPLWLWRPVFSSYFLKLDDFVYLSRARSAAMLGHHLLTPHNGHLTPLFLVQTHVFARLAGSIEGLPAMMGWAAYAGLAATMAGIGHVVARQTGRAEWGLAAMAGVGLSSVPGPALLWYSASQALLTGAVMMAMLAALEAWSARGWPVALAMGFLLAIAAPFCWSAGYTAGLAGAAYLWAENRPRARLAAALIALGSTLAAAFAWYVASDAIRDSTRLAQLSLTDLMTVRRILDHTEQAAWEKLVFNNLGLDAPTTAGQAVMLSIAALVGWRIHRSRAETSSSRGFWNPLTAAGAVIVISNYALVFSTRGRALGYEHLRHLGWYDAIPQLGAVLFAAGVWAGPRLDAWHCPISPPSRKALSGVIALMVLLFVMQSPRARRLVVEYDGLAARVQRLEDQTPSEPADWAGRAGRQRAALAALDRIEHDQAQAPTGRAELVRQSTHWNVPGAPGELPGYSLADLIDAGAEPSSRPPGRH